MGAVWSVPLAERTELYAAVFVEVGWGIMLLAARWKI